MTILGSVPIKAVLIDITGVLYESGTRQAIPGSVDAISKLRSSGIRFKFVTNETQNTCAGLAAKLRSFGFEDLIDKEIFAPAPAVKSYLIKNQLRPHFLIHPWVKDEFEGIDTTDPNCVVIGDAAEHFSYENVNRAFQTLISIKPQQAPLITMGFGRYYKDHGNLVIDVGAYAKALEYAADTQAVVIGKPSDQYFRAALEQVECEPQNAVMIGDDLTGDVGGSQAVGMRGLLVKTGKFRPGRDDTHATIKPDAIVDNLMAAIDLIMDTNQTAGGN